MLARRGVDAVAIPYRADAVDHSAAARSSAARRSAGSGELTSTGAAGHRMREGQPRGVQELALEAEAARRAVLGVARDGMADRLQVRADLVRAPGLQAHAQQRRARAAPRSSSKCVHRRARVVGVGRHPRAHAPVAPERRVDRARCAPAGGPRRARGTRASIVAAPAARALQRAVHGLGAGDDEQAGGVAVQPVHDARRARRPRRRRRMPASACASVPVAVPARRVHDDAGGLVDDEQVLVLVGDRVRRVAAPSRRAAPRSGSSTATSSPRAQHGGAWAPRAPSTSTRPASIRRCARAREPSGAARNASSRSPASLRRRSPLHRVAGRSMT